MQELTFNCSYCGVKIEADATLAGKLIQCPKCSHAVKVMQGLMREGMVLGGYTLEKLLGKGGMGEVWLATQMSMGRKVGLKILAHGLSKDPEFIARFNQEMKTVAKLDHPGIVSAYEAGYDKGFYFLATSYVNGETLESKIDSGKIFGEDEALAVAEKIAEALKYAWNKHRILHRDIKPANIMIDDNGDVKLMDMGISKSLVEDKSLTMTGSILGTPYYMSPEQAKAEKDIDFRADIYSLGATLYHMLTGHLPYSATTTMGVLARMISENAAPAREINPKISVKCEKLMAKMMDKDKAGRQSSWQEVIDDIGKVMDSKITEEEYSGGMGKRLAKAKWKLILFVVFVVMAASSVFIFQNMRQEPNQLDIPEIPFEELTVKGEIDKGGGTNEIKKSHEIPSGTASKNKLEESGEKVSHGDSGKNIKVTGQDNADSFDDIRPNVVQKAEPIQNPTVRNDEVPRGPNLKKALSDSIGISEDEAMRLIPIVRTYARELKQLRENEFRPGNKIHDLRDKVHAITLEAKRQSETILTKDQSSRFVQFLEQERRQSFRNNFWRNAGIEAGGR